MIVCCLLETTGISINLVILLFFTEMEQVEPIATLEITVGPKGGRYSLGSLSILIPEGAVSEPVSMKLHLFVDGRLIPPAAQTHDGYILSLFCSFEPHRLTFLKPVQVYFSALVDSKGWRLSLMRAMCNTSTLSQLWQPKAIVTFNSDVEQVNVEDVDCEDDLASGTLSSKHLCGHYWFGNLADMFLTSKTMLFSVCGYQPISTVNTWNLTIHCHDDCLKVIEVH